MSRIRGKDTKIEIILRKALWKKGYRYRKNYKAVMKDHLKEWSFCVRFIGREALYTVNDDKNSYLE